MSKVPPKVPPPSAAYLAKSRGDPVKPRGASVTPTRSMSQRELQDSELDSLRSSAEVPETWGEALGLTLPKPELMRTTSSHKVLMMWPTIFSSVTEDPHAMYAMSKQAKNIDTFVSHSWRTPGWARALALAWYMGRRRFFVAAVVLPLLWAVVARHFDLRVVAWSLPHGASKGDIVVIHQGWTSVVVPAAFVLVAWSVTRKAGKIYLDRCCMCQYNTSLMQDSIHQLGAYIARSKNFLILWDENYCSRLWCMYEVATFCALRPLEQLHIVPIQSVPPLITLWCYHTVASFGICFLGSYLLLSDWAADLTVTYVPGEVEQVVVLFFLCASTLAPCYACIMWYLYDTLLDRVRGYEELHRQLSTFSVAKLNCAVESDRQVVHAQIVTLFGSISTFENIVRTQVAPFISRGAVTSMPYELILLGVSSHVWVGIDQLTFQPTFSNTWWHILIMFIFIVGSGDFLGMYALGVLVRQLHHSEDVPLLHKLGVDKWSDKGRRTLGISLATAFNAVVNGVLVATISPNIPARYKLVPSVALGVFSYFLTTAQRTTTKSDAAPHQPPKLARRASSRLRLLHTAQRAFSDAAPQAATQSGV